MKLVLKIVMCFFVTISTLVAQNSQKLNLGDKAPSLVLTTAFNTTQSFNFPYNKSITLVFFWSSTVSVSKENLFKYSLINLKYNSIQFKNCEGFEIISVALQRDKKNWEQDIKKYNLEKINNCIALKGYKDFFVSQYNLTETPTSFLIDELGKIIFINPDIEILLDYLNERKNSINGNDQQNFIVGKIVYGSDKLKPLINKKIFILNLKNDTLEKTKTDNEGVFQAKNPKTYNDVYLEIEPNEEINNGENVYLANEAGKNITSMNFAKNGFQYNLKEVDCTFLRPSNATKIKITNLKDLNVTDNLFKLGGFNLNPESKKLLNLIIIKLNENLKTQLEIISHTDCKGEEKLNLELSNKRGKSIYDYLISKGITKTRLKMTGKGESEPITKCSDGVSNVKETELNTRTELKFTDID